MIRTRVGYTGGSTPDPTYRQIGDHLEALQVDFDPTVISYAALLDVFWSSHRPTRAPWRRQYMAALFYSDAQYAEAKASRDRVAEALGREVQTMLAPLERFYRAEHYHQKYFLRRRDDLLRAFAHYTPDEFVDSTVAARLNARLGGHEIAEDPAELLQTAETHARP